jgi:flagellar basal-body rod protein FlgF
LLRGLYTAAAGMIALQRRHDTITNNIANANTPGFKQGETVQRSFPEMLVSRIEALESAGRTLKNRRAVGSLPHGVLSEETVLNFAQGDIVETGNPYHVALWDEGMPVDPETGERPHAFFTVLTPDGVRYTRNGEWTLDVNNTLVTAQGFPVLDSDGNPITVPDAQSFEVDVNGNVTFANADGVVDTVQLGIVSAPDPNLFIQRGDGLYEWTGADVPDAAAPNVEVYQGFTERSNVNPQQAMVDLMQVQRLYEANQRTIQAYDRSLEKAVNEIGRLG